jgi:hypothetical protein
VEIVANDHDGVYIYSGHSGDFLFRHRFSSLTWSEYPTIADLDADGHAEILVTNGNTVRAYEADADNWARTHDYWTGYNYHITEVGSNGEVPAPEPPSWQLHNSYRVNASLPSPERLFTELTASRLRVIDQGQGQPAALQMRIANAGTQAAGGPVDIAFYAGDPVAGGLLLGEAGVEAPAPGAYRDVRLEVSVPADDADVYGRVDPGDTVEECREDNNTARAPFVAANVLGEIAVAPDRDAYSPGATAALVATVTNAGALAASFSVAMQVEDDQGGLVEVFEPVPVTALDSGAARAIAQSWRIGPVLAGEYRVRAVLLDTGGGPIAEAAAGFTVLADLPANSRAQLTAVTDRPEYHIDDRVVVDVSA